MNGALIAAAAADRRHDLGGAPGRERQPDAPGRAARAARWRSGLTYLRAIEAAGGLPLVMPPLTLDAIEPLLDRLDGICLSGGPDLDPATYGARPHPELGPIEPELDHFELALARAADDRGLPMLAICRGAPGPEHRPRRHAAPAPARPLRRDSTTARTTPGDRGHPRGRDRARTAGWPR